jgi:hypothetical protein
MYIRVIAIAAALCSVQSSIVRADVKLTACVAKLSADGQLIFNKVRAEQIPSADLRTLVRAAAIQFAGEGKISMAAAPDAALAAAACLELVRK